MNASPEAAQAGLAAAQLPSPLGELTLVASGQGLRAVLWPEDDPGRVPLPALSAEAGAGHEILAQAAAELDAYFAGTLTRFMVPLDFHGTAFQVAVWRALTAIPFGETRTYAQIAATLGQPSAARAVGAANGRNPISIIAPCHRVIGASGRLTGFAGGLAAKAWLLGHEAGDRLL